MACPKGSLQGFSVDGYFAEYAAVDARSALKLPDGMDLVSAAPLFCAGLTAYHGVKKCNLQAGKYIGIMGVGGLGHLGVQILSIQCLIRLAVYEKGDLLLTAALFGCFSHSVCREARPQANRYRYRQCATNRCPKPWCGSCFQHS